MRAIGQAGLKASETSYARACAIADPDGRKDTTHALLAAWNRSRRG